MNDAGLAVGWLWQSNVTFHNRFVLGRAVGRVASARIQL